LVKNRRSIHRFKPAPVPDEYIDKIIQAAHWAPSGFNLQPWEFVVVKDSKLQEGIVQIFKEASANSSKMETAREKW
jgi:nitroreductase